MKPRAGRPDGRPARLGGTSSRLSERPLARRRGRGVNPSDGRVDGHARPPSGPETKPLAGGGSPGCQMAAAQRPSPSSSTPLQPGSAHRCVRRSSHANNLRRRRWASTARHAKVAPATAMTHQFSPRATGNRGPSHFRSHPARALRCHPMGRHLVPATSNTPDADRGCDPVSVELRGFGRARSPPSGT